MILEYKNNEFVKAQTMPKWIADEAYQIAYRLKDFNLRLKQFLKTSDSEIVDDLEVVETVERVDATFRLARKVADDFNYLEAVFSGEE